MKNYTGLLPYFFVNCAGWNGEEEEAVLAALKAVGFRFRFSDYDEMKWEESLRQTMNDALCVGVVSVIDPSYQYRENAATELIMAAICQKPVIALVFDKAILPERALHLLKEATVIKAAQEDASYIRTLAETAPFADCLTLSPIVAGPDFEIDGDVLVKYHGASETVTVPEGIAVIGASAFSKNMTVTEIVLPASVRRIDERAFSNCCFLRRIEIGEGVEEIGYAAFWNCRKLESITLPETALSLGTHLFFWCYRLESAKLPEGLREIPEGTFVECTALKRFEFSQNLISIGRSAFMGCSHLAAAFLPKGLQTIGKEAFSGCRGMVIATVFKGCAYEKDAFPPQVTVRVQA